MNRERLRRARREITGLADARLDWISFAQATSEVLAGIVPFDRNCWHTVDPGTVLFTGNLNQGIACSGTWLATYEYLVDDVNKWWFLARSGRIAGATSLATHGDPSRSARYRSHENYGIGDELRVSFVIGGTYWAAAGLLRDSDRRSFTEDEVRCLASLSEPIADGFRRSLLITAPDGIDSPAHGPGVIVFDGDGNLESLSPGAAHWIGQMVEVPPPSIPAESKIIQAVAARAQPRPGPRSAGGRRAVPRTDQVRFLAAAIRHAAGRRCRRTYRSHHPTCHPSRRRSARHARVRAVRARIRGGAAVHGGALHEADGASPRPVAAYRPGPSQVDLRQDRCPEPQRACQPDLPRALCATLGRHPGRSCRLGCEGITDPCWD
jgi:hypothetical protein